MQEKSRSSDKKYDRFMRFSHATDTILKNIQKYKNDRLSAYGLRSMHLMFLYCLAKSDKGMTPGELAKSCSVDKAFISRVTTELKKLGYVDYFQSGRESSARSYKKRLSLTEAGRRVMDSVNTLVEESVEKIADGIPKDQLETFYSVLSHMDHNLLALAEE